jgi:hypothetical protein
VARRTFPLDGTPLLLSEESVIAKLPGHPDSPALARTFFHHQPSPRIEVELEAREQESALADLVDPLLQEITLAYPGRGGIATIRPYHYTLFGGDRVQATAVVDEMETVSPSEMTSAVFALPNFMEIYTRRDLRRLIGTDFGDDRWMVQIQAEADFPARRDRLRGVGGALVTHRGVARRRDSGTFTAGEARELLEALHFFLSFARGAWTGPLLPVGLDQTGSQVWERWDGPKTTSWSSAGTWIDVLSGHLLDGVFSGFMRKWMAPGWRDTLQRAIHWYVSATQQAGAVEGAIMLTQVALELLAWQLLVSEGGVITRNKFNGLSASAKLRALLDHLRIPLTIPSALTAARDAGGTNKDWDGPAAIVAIRNNTAHARSRGGDALSRPDVLSHVWQLGLWYLELSLLYACEHKGGYSNRFAEFRVGHPEPVSWTLADPGDAAPK